MDELITKQQAIDAIEKARAYIGHNMERAVGAAFIEILDDVEKSIIGLPPAQFATDTNVGNKLGTNLAQLGTDLISRQTAIDALKKAYWDKDIQSAKDDPCIVDAMTDWAIRQVKALPSAQPERKKGKWIPVTRIEEWSKEEGLTGFPPEVAEFPNCTIKYVDATEPDEVDAVKCSECGTVFDFTDARNWCSECGADMRGEQDE